LKSPLRQSRKASASMLVRNNEGTGPTSDVFAPCLTAIPHLFGLSGR
jgi:hypothetical protein